MYLVVQVSNRPVWLVQTRGCEVWLESPSTTGMRLAASEVHCPQPRRIWPPSNEPCQYPWPCYSDNWTVLEGQGRGLTRAKMWPLARRSVVETNWKSVQGWPRTPGRRQAASRRRSLSLASSRDFWGPMVPAASLDRSLHIVHCHIATFLPPPSCLLALSTLYDYHNTTQHSTTKPRLP